ncbi:NUDIX hydrolase [Lentilitoribacter sp. EG35]|uniref:NUDIX hydrolase n=1 Tax=Lentilitoribacter sp. EG35 TaxID=3234192 RepID=UPI0034600DFA
MKPKDAATLLLLDRDKERPAVLMGKRSSKHAFMPNVFVFPGGRKDSSDWRVKSDTRLNEAVVSKLMERTHSRFSHATAHSLAIAAARELHEETSLHLSKNGELFDLSHLRYIARAITPLGQNRRYDTRFFTCFCDEVEMDLSTLKDSNELTELQWVDVQSPQNLDFPDITARILNHLRHSLNEDRTLPHTTKTLHISNK